MDGERDACLHLVAFAVSFAVSFIMERNDFMVAYYNNRVVKVGRNRRTGDQEDNEEPRTG